MKRVLRPILERLVARIATVADVYDDPTTDRTHKEAYSHDRAVEMIRKESGSDFDPVIVDAFGRTGGGAFVVVESYPWNHRLADDRVVAPGMELTVTGQEMLAEAVLASKALLTRYLPGFNEENCTRQATNLPNHAVWCLGHCALTMHRVGEYIDGEPIPASDFTITDAAGDKDSFNTESIAFGSAPADKSDAYPPLARALEVFESACDRLAAAVRIADEATLSRTIPWGSSELSLWFVVLRVTFHNGMHGGQITDLRRALGLDLIIK